MEHRGQSLSSNMSNKQYDQKDGFIFLTFHLSYRAIYFPHDQIIRLTFFYYIISHSTTRGRLHASIQLTTINESCGVVFLQMEAN